MANELDRVTARLEADADAWRTPNVESSPSAVERVRARIDGIVGGNGFVTLSVSDARELLALSPTADKRVALTPEEFLAQRAEREDAPISAAMYRNGKMREQGCGKLWLLMEYDAALRGDSQSTKGDGE